MVKKKIIEMEINGKELEVKFIFYWKRGKDVLNVVFFFW